MSNLEVNVSVTMQVNLNVNCNICKTLGTNKTYAHTDVTSRRNAICPTPASGRQGHKNSNCCTVQSK